MCRFALAKLADANGTELDVRRQIDEALALIEISSFRADNFMNADLAWVLCSLGQFENASQCLCKRLHTSQKLHEYGDMLYGISTFARVLAHQGVSTRAAELLGLIFTHPNSPRGFLEKHPKMARLRADLEATLGTPAYAAAWERGTRLDVEQAVHQLLKDFDPKTNDSITQANQQLSNPLTERELEVLRLLAEGLTNPRIGERLFIETGTVKGHVNKILQKLDVEDRQQAAIRAYTLRLV